MLSGASATDLGDTLAGVERARRRTFRDPLERSADAYLVRRGTSTEPASAI
jgi:hypothetical protein